MLVYVNGELLSKKEATVSVYDHGYLYGDGIFEGIRVYDGNVFRLKALPLDLLDMTSASPLQRRKRLSSTLVLEKYIWCRPWPPICIVSHAF